MVLACHCVSKMAHLEVFFWVATVGSESPLGSPLVLFGYHGEAQIGKGQVGLTLFNHSFCNITSYRRRKRTWQS